MKKVLFITNIPVPYRVSFFNELGKYVDLTVLFEGKTAERYGVNFDWNLDSIRNFRAIFLSEGDIIENRVDRGIFQYLKKGMYDEIVATNYAYRTEMAAIVYMKLHGIPYYMETDGGMVRRGENFFKRLLKKFLVSGAKGYFSPSASSDDYLAFYGAWRERIFRYPFTSLSERDILPVPLTREQKEEYRQALGMPEKKVILGVGQFIVRKGFDVLLDALSAMRGTEEEIGVYLVGGVPVPEYIEAAERLSLSGICVHFVPFQNSKTVSAYYKAADLFVLPTREDIWGLVINEAMAHGLPVLTTTACVAGLALVEDGKNGFLVPPGEAAPLAAALEKLLACDLQGMGAESLQKIRPYTFENMALVHAERFAGENGSSAERAKKENS